MIFDCVETLSLPGHPAKPNEDNFVAEDIAAAVLDGATPLADPLLPGRSDAAWLSQFGARRLVAHIKNGDNPRLALRHALADAERSFQGLARRKATLRYQLPFASMVFAVPQADSIDLLWYGDCAGVLRHSDGRVEVIGEAFAKRGEESNVARRYRDDSGLPPVGALDRPEALPRFQQARAKANTPGNTWLFGVEPKASEHVSRQSLTAAPGSLLLLCTDGFLALASDYGRYTAETLIGAAAQSLAGLGEELRRIEDEDSDGMTYPRFKKSDDATAVLLRLG